MSEPKTHTLPRDEQQELPPEELRRIADEKNRDREEPDEDSSETDKDHGN